MKKYIGTKTVYAQPMTAEEAKEKGYKVGGNTGNGYEVEYKDGYKSWSPDKAFEEAYRVAETPLDRLEIEFSELEVKLNKLRDFLQRQEHVEIVGETQACLMRIQISGMSHYRDCLYTRISMLKNRERTRNEQ